MRSHKLIGSKLLTQKFPGALVIHTTISSSVNQSDIGICLLTVDKEIVNLASRCSESNGALCRSNPDVTVEANVAAI